LIRLLATARCYPPAMLSPPHASAVLDIIVNVIYSNYCKLLTFVDLSIHHRLRVLEGEVGAGWDDERGAPSPLRTAPMILCGLTALNKMTKPR
jgi:hypothetical protein